MEVGNPTLSDSRELILSLSILLGLALLLDVVYNNNKKSGFCLP